MSTMPHQSILTTIGMTLVIGCGSKSEDTGALDALTAGCDAPLAEAGDAQSFPLGSRISLNGGDSTWCSRLKKKDISFNWSFERVPSGSEVNDTSLSENRDSDSANPSFIPDVPGEYVLSLRVTDPTSASTPDYVVISISSSDLPPTSSCGEDVVGQVGVATTLDGGASSDPEGAELTFRWSLSSTPECSNMSDMDLFDQGTAMPSLIPDCDGLYVVSLVVSDGLQDSEPDYCSVDSRSDNAPPVAESGMGGNLPPCAENPFRLSGWESYDPDGDPMTYSWSVVSAPIGADPEVYGFEDDTAVGPYFTWDKAGAWSFQLQVSDGVQTSSPDVVTYIIGGEGSNNSPTANAGENQSISVDAPCSYVDGEWVCEPCPEASVTVDGTNSTDPDGDTLNFSWSESSGDLSWSGTTTPVTDLIFPTREITYGSTETIEYDVSLDVSDCGLSDDAHITVTYTCRGG